MLQQRMKWKTKQANLVQGQIVIIKDEETHPAKWPLGKIIETHPGKDGNIRVVTLKLQNGILKRPVHKLCPLEVTNSSRAEEANHVTSLLTSRITKNTATSERPSKSSKLMMWFLTILMLATQTKSLYINDTSKSGASVTKLKNNTAIYLEPISKMDIINSKWNLIVYYELGTYYDRMHKIQEFINRLENQCKILTYYEDACIMITATLNDKYNSLKANNELFMKKQNRKKRAPFEFVGSIYHILFGIMDADDRENMESNIRNIFDNQKDIAKLFKRQTSVVDSTINILKKTTDEVNRNFEKMNQQLNKFYNELIKDQNAERMTLMFQILTISIGIVMDECEEIQTSIINLLIDINHGRINPKLLKPSQLNKEIEFIRNKLPHKLILPGNQSGIELKKFINQ
uniref:Envelope fusion protein n=1 Tax=Bactrocera dorsalis TaxID=27457 RepID=A0A034WFR5_BACDO